ncbi:uncharacterized protein K460DRAFT_101851 [Cucurbitaria berberidis CBS 394.84]|uniref:Uncharacterized protein n=1 Tax=Cucurbitaria berberidis CBS 394.84 TaxID=1168544 RepID=A0A9P4GGI5_9PLEO|nr:uncharacterized protein K460DRAFT_101851 [Cucurbitaria berberidis CBS 394.84]KAF1845024.1 hypothetical protein K460DRAFT_101851 [Cucurbitaria berberidis CBS 394.84]
MKIFSVILSFVLLVAALPSRELQEFGAVEGNQLSPAVGGQPGQMYCFSQIITELRKFPSRSRRAQSPDSKRLPSQSPRGLPRAFLLPTSLRHSTLTISRCRSTNDPPSILQPAIPDRRTVLPWMQATFCASELLPRIWGLDLRF